MAIPSITITATIPGTSISANTGEVEFYWAVNNSPTVVCLGGSAPGAEVLPDGVFTDGGGELGPNIFPSTRGSFLDSTNSTHSLDVYAANADGGASDHEYHYAKIPVGYHDAAVPGAPVYEGELELIRGYLEEIHDRLSANVLTGLPVYIDEFNGRVGNPSDRFPVFDDMAYLSGEVGTGNLTDDILNHMRELLVYITPYTLPRGYRPGTLASGASTICGGSVLGKSTREWVALCIASGADDLTLLHELFHHASRSHNESELRAFAISMCAYNILP